MPMRITTSMTMNTYRYNLMQSTNKVSNAQNKVLTHRNFNSYAEDPAAATHAWRIRRAFTKNNAYITNNSDTFSRFSIAYAAMDKIKTDLANNEGLKNAVLGNNDPLASGRYALGAVVYNGAESVIQGINGAKYGDHFVFAGKDGLNVPFSWSDDGQTLYYRGVNVDSGGMKAPRAEEDPAIAALLKQTTPMPTAPKAPAVPDEAAYPDPGDYKLALEQYEKDKKQYETDYIQYRDELAEWNTVNAWKDYYNHKTDTKPEGEMPQEIKDIQTAIDKLAVTKPNKTEAERISNGWYEYYTHKTDEKPAAEAPKWLANADKDQYGYPTQEALDARNAQNPPLTDKEKAEDAEWLAYYKDQSDYRRLQEMEKEETNVDLGLGLQEDGNGDMINGSVFNMALPGIKMIGYGVDADGDPRNLATLMKKYSAVLERADPSTGQWSEEDRQEADRLLNKINAVNNDVIKSYSDDVAAQAQFLETNGDRLKEQGYTLNEERGAIEDIDPADAISQFLYDYTCYNAALKVGTQLLSQSLIDYMN